MNILLYEIPVFEMHFSIFLNTSSTLNISLVWAFSFTLNYIFFLWIILLSEFNINTDLDLLSKLFILKGYFFF